MSHPEVSNWVLSGVVIVLGTILWWSIRSWIKGIQKEFAEMKEQLTIIGKQNVGFEKDINRLDRAYESHDKRMHDYSERLREVEHTQAACRNCNEK